MTITKQLYLVDSVIVNLICQLSWAMVPRYFIKNYSGYFCKGDFQVRLIFISVDNE